MYGLLTSSVRKSKKVARAQKGKFGCGIFQKVGGKFQMVSMQIPAMPAVLSNFPQHDPFAENHQKPRL
jgi:hypothetical protein